MFQRPRTNSKGVSFGGPELIDLTTGSRHQGIQDEPPAKKKKLSETPIRSNTSNGSKSHHQSRQETQYQYNPVATILLGATPAESNQAGTPADHLVPHSASAPPQAEQLHAGQELIELKAEEVIHFKKPTMREAAAAASPYAPGSMRAPNSGPSTAPAPKPSWIKRDYRPGLDGLHEEIEDFYRYLQPTREERLLRIDLVERLRKVIRTRFPKAEVRYFGSLATDLLLPTSDIDLVVLGVSPIQSNLWIVRSLLQRYNFSAVPTVIAHAKVPLVKFTDETSGIDVDISFDQPNGLRNTQVVNAFAAKYKVYRPLLLLLKYMLQQLTINEPYNGGLGSYGLSLMLASFLQMHPNTNNVTGETEQNLAFLLLDFFALYGKRFNYYHTGISVRGCGSYYSKFERDWIDSVQPFLVSLEDPNDTTNDVGRSCFRILTVRSYFQDAYSKLSNLPRHSASESLLARIIRFDPELDHIRSHFPALVEQLMQSSYDFMENVKHIADMYDDATGQMKPGADHAALGSSQALRLPDAAQVRSDSKPLSHIMFDYDGDSSELLSDDEGDRFYSGRSHSDDDSDRDQVVPIIISDEEDDKHNLPPPNRNRYVNNYTSNQKNPKKRKR